MKPKVINTQIYSEASEWLIEFRSGDIDVKGRRDFYHWLKISPEHMRAYLELAAIWNEGTELDSRRRFDDVRLAADIQAETNVTPLQRAHAPAGHHTRPSHRKIITLAASLALGFLSLGVWYAYARETYSTNVGEDRVLTLSDGSTVELNSNSRVHLNFSKDVRGVQLLQGQALFHVAKDHDRPFIVRAGNAQIRAVGTQFDVYRNRASTTVTVVEGTVAVSSSAFGSVGTIAATGGEAAPVNPLTGGSRATNAMLVAAGEQVIVSPVVLAPPVKADVAAATAWTQHELVFKGASLQDVVLEFNRYNERHLTIRDSAIANLKVTGIFSSADPSSLLRFLKARPDIEVTEASSEILISQKP
jgi:transmembrane sensor